MNITAAVQAIRDTAEKEIKKLLAEQDKPWEPDKEGWTVTGDGRTVLSILARQYHILGNAFPTREAAEQAIARRKAYVFIVREIARVNREEGWVINWGDCDQKKYYLYLDLIKFGYSYNNTTRTRHDELYGCKKAVYTIICHHADTWRIAMGISNE